MDIILAGLISLLSVSLGNACSGDDDARVDWLIDHAVEVRPATIADADFADLAPIARAIGDARIVALGEVNHLDGGTFAVRSRLIRFLHEAMGFDVLAWEAGLLDCQRMNEALRAKGSLQDAKDRMMQEGWPESAVLHPLFEYARASWQTSHPLEMAGFDLSRPAHGEQHLNERLDRILARMPALSINANDVALVRALMARAVDTDHAPPMADDVRAAQRGAMRSLIAQVERERASATLAPAAREIDFDLEVLRATLAFAEVISIKPLMMKAADPLKMLEYGSMREREMTRLVEWLADVYYRDKKIILSAATAHLIRSGTAIDRIAAVVASGADELGPMGERLARHFGSRMYTIAFTAWGGEYGAIFAEGDVRRSFTRPVTRAPHGSLEELCHRTTMPALFLDVRHVANDHWLRQPIIASPLGFAPDRGRWSEAVDAFFFIDIMTPDRVLPKNVKK